MHKSSLHFPFVAPPNHRLGFLTQTANVTMLEIPRRTYWTYAGQHKDRRACGLGMLTQSGDIEYGPPNSKVYAEYGPDGKYDGRCFERVCWYPTTTVYSRYERGREKERGKVKARVKDHAYVDGAEDDGEYDGRFGRCKYNGEDCASDDPRLLALIAHVAPVEVRPAAAAPYPQSPPSRPQAIVRWISRLVLHPQALATAMAAEVPAPRRTLALVAVRHKPTTAAMQRATTQ
jgi:hypothetical protein